MNYNMSIKEFYLANYCNSNATANATAKNLNCIRCKIIKATKMDTIGSVYCDTCYAKIMDHRRRVREAMAIKEIAKDNNITCNDINMATFKKDNTMNQYKYIYEATLSYYNDLHNDDKLASIKDDDNISKFKYVLDRYKLQHNYTQNGIANKLQGLWLEIAYSNFDIANLLQAWHVKPTDKNIENYWQVMAFRLLQLYKAIDNATKLQRLLTK